MSEDVEKLFEVNNTSSNSEAFEWEPGVGAINTLKFLGWLDLVAGIIGSIVIWANYSTKEVTLGEYYKYTEKVTDPVGVGLGFLVLFQGIFICILFLVIASIAENLIAIRKNTTPRT